MKKFVPIICLLAAAGFTGCKKQEAPVEAPKPIAAVSVAPVAQDPNAVNPAELEGAAPAGAAAPAAASPQAK